MWLVVFLRRRHLGVIGHDRASRRPVRTHCCRGPDTPQSDDDGPFDSHPDLQPNGDTPVAPSAIKPEGAETYISADSGMVPTPTPRALTPMAARRFRLGSPLNDWDESTFYGGDERGYTDYPSLGEESA